jgi:hypothetical protein
MPLLQLRVAYRTNDGIESTTSGAVLVKDGELAKLFPKSSLAGAGWAHGPLLEIYVADLMRRTVFPDEITPIENGADLKRLGVSDATAILSDGKGQVHTVGLL